MGVTPVTVSITIPEGESRPVVKTVADIPVEVRPSVVSCDPPLSLSFQPPSQTVTLGTNVTFTETVSVSPNATPGSLLHARVDFLIDNQHRDGFLQTISVQVPKHPSKLDVQPGSSGCHRSGTLVAVLTDDKTKGPIAGATVQFTMGQEGGPAITDSNGRAQLTITPVEPPGTYPITAVFAGDAQHLPATGHNQYTIGQQQTSLVYTGPTVFENGQPVTLSGVLTEADGGAPISGCTVKFTLGAGASAQLGTGITDASGVARCTIPTVQQPLGFGRVSLRFDGTPCYASSSASANTLIFEFPAGGTFVIGDVVPGASVGTQVYFWGAQWHKENTLSGGPTPPAFKGFEDSLDHPACGQSWTSRPGNSSDPPATIPSYMGVIVSSSISQSGSTIAGDTVAIVVVRTDAGYEPNPGHPGTGRIVGRVC